MNQVKIKSLSLVNFKGIRKLELKDLQKVTNIYGDNGTGKTSVFDAFTWLLFGKDSSDRTAFEIKTLDQFNNQIPKLDHEVSAVMEINGEEIEVKRILREKWVTKRGAEEAEFAGNETVYFWNDVPLSAKEFSNKISQVIDEKIFKLITNPLAFNSLKWQDRRMVLIDMVGGVRDMDIAAGNVQFEELLSKLGNKTLEEYQKQVAASLKKMKAELKMIPTRIDEVERGKPEAMEFGKIREQIEAHQMELAKVEDQLMDQVNADKELTEKRRAINKKIEEAEDKIAEAKRHCRTQARMKFDASTSEEVLLKSQLTKVESQIKEVQNQKESIAQLITVKEHEIKTLENQIEELKDTWSKVSAETFQMNEDECKCPTCKREFEAGDIDAKKESLEINFNTHKRTRLDNINLKGQNNAEAIKKLKEYIDESNQRLRNVMTQLNELNNKHGVILENIKKEQAKDLESEDSIYSSLIDGSTEIKEAKNSIESLQEEYDSIKHTDKSEFEEKKSKCQTVISELLVKLRDEEQIKSADKRIQDLKDEERSMAQAIANDEREQFVVESFVKAKVETLEKRINIRFEMVSFKMFATQINGGEVETCETLINGVPFSDANNAAKINAGIDIINTLTDYYQVNAPIFIDNRESVVRLTPSNSQIVNLIVDAGRQKLEVMNDVSEVEFETV